MSLGDEIVARIARVGALHAAPVAPPSGAPGPAAAREGDPIKHASFLGALALSFLHKYFNPPPRY
ncbi:hypothetical protein [Photorhabdus tasmaniensis]|uniref:hypothetical protein n=1 Tax=Photorhabdus tasmaniensis TaxID=1004159 RepID=UPI00140BC8CE|nr:hypothetical protein [Photorhabdus tasmaniensis]